MPNRIQVVYSETHLAHDGLIELVAGREIACYESPDRALAILRALQRDPRFAIQSPTDHGLQPVLAVHDAALVDLLEAAWTDALAPGVVDGTRPLIPDTFAVSAYAGPMALAALPASRADRLGAYCFDTATPIVAGTYAAARSAVDVALSAAELVRDGAPLSYGLCRPPGHHAGRGLFGGYCYFNNAAIVAESLRARHARVAILDIDYHHGNGTQQLFWERSDVLYVSLHADPAAAYPYFSGYASEVGVGTGVGFTRNLPLPRGTDLDGYASALLVALQLIDAFAPDAPLVLSLGFDTHIDDPIGGFALRSEDYAQLGAMIGEPGRPTIVLQEGGYAVAALGASATGLLGGLAQALSRR